MHEGENIMLSSIKKLDTLDIEIDIKKDYVNMAVSQISLLHLDDDGFITIALKKNEDFIQYHYKASVLKQHIGKALTISGTNIYITPNSFYKPYRKIENIRKLNALYIDIDYYKIESMKELSFKEVTDILERDYFKDKIPVPNFIINTGRGMALYWLIEPVPYKALPLWNVMQKHFLDKLMDLGADAKSIDSARLMRLSGSTNQKSMRIVEIYVNDDIGFYKLRDLQEEFLPKLTPYVKNPCKRVKGKIPKVVNLFNLYNLHHSRLCDLVKLQEIREGYCRNKNGELMVDSQREFMCFLYRYWCCCYLRDTEKALKDTLHFNNNFKVPLSKKEVEKVTVSAEKAYEKWLKDSPNGVYKNGGYNYRNRALIDKLSITLEEMKDLKTIIDKDEVKRRNNEKTKEAQKISYRNEEGITKRQMEKQRRIESIMKLKEMGHNQKAIAFKLKITQQAVSKIFKELRRVTENVSRFILYTIYGISSFIDQIDLDFY